MIRTLHEGLLADGINVPITKLCDWFGVPRRTVYYKPTKSTPKINPRFADPIENAFATIRHRTKCSKSCLTADGMLHMMFKLGQCAETNWRKLRGFSHLADVYNDVKFTNGIRQNAPDHAAA